MSDRQTIARRFVPPVAVWLALGAITNVLVAWACVASSRGWYPMIADNVPNDEQFAWWQQHAPSGAEAIPKGMFESSAFGMTFEHLYPSDTAPRGICAERVRAGWPALSLIGGVWSHKDFGPVVTSSGSFGESRPFPYVPLWPGFAINTVLYTTMLWVLSEIPGFFSRRIRIKRGLCPECAYPIGTSDVCTECGARVNGSSTPHRTSTHGAGDGPAH